MSDVPQATVSFKVRFVCSQCKTPAPKLIVGQVWTCPCLGLRMGRKAKGQVYFAGRGEQET